MKTVKIKDSKGTIQTRRTLSVGKTTLGRWAIYGEFLNPITFSVDRHKLFDLKYPHYRTKRAAEASLEHLRENSDITEFVSWHTTNREGVEGRAKQLGVEILWIA